LESSLKNPEINFNSDSEASLVYEFGDFQLHVGPRLLFKNGEELALTPKTVATLSVLASRSEQVVSKDELMQRVWPDAVVEESNLAQYLHILRKTLGTMPDGRPHVETLKGRGYRLNAPVRARSSYEKNGHTPVRDVGVPISDADPSPSQPRSANSMLLIAGLFVVLACVGLVVFVGKTRGWFAPTDPPKPASDVIVTPLTSGENVTQTTISHDGKFFVYSDYDGDRSRLVLEAVDRSSKSEILPRFAGRIENLSFTPDNAEIYFNASDMSAADNGLYRISVNGGSPVKVLDTMTSPVSFSADGSKMVFVRANPKSDGREQIVETSNVGSGETVLLEAKSDQRFSPDAAMSHNGRFVVFGSITRTFPIVCSLTKLDLYDRSITPLTNEEWDSCYRIAFAKDDSGIAFVGTRRGEAFSIRRDQVYYLDFTSPESRRLTGDANWHDPMSLGMTDSDEILALTSTRISQVWTINPDGNPTTAEQITQGQSDGRGGIVAMPDDKIDFLTRDGDGAAIFEAEANGQSRRRIVGSPTMQELRGSPDGRFLVYAEQQNDLTQLFRIDRNGDDRRQLTFDSSSKIDSSVSPDGSWVVYNNDEGNEKYSLQRIPADGGPPEKLSDGYCGVPHYSHSGKFISCYAGDKIRIVAADTGKPVTELIPDANFVTNTGALWSADDKYLVYRVVKNGATNLWRQPVLGGNPRPLTNFPKGDLYNFSYSSDGKKLYLSRGTQNRNAILIRDFR